MVLSFIYFCEAYRGIPPHFFLWRYLFNIKFTGKRIGIVGAVMFCLRLGLKEKWIDMDLLDNTAGWRSEWFYLGDQQPVLLKRTVQKPERIPGLGSKAVAERFCSGTSRWFD
jgi:hypothetical protein